MRYWEDFKPGEVIELGTHEMTEAEIVDFASRYDPQPFHVDAQAAERSAFGGLIASGWHTVCVFMRLYVDEVLLGSTSVGSPGMDGIRWLAPVRPGDVLSGVAKIVEATPSAIRPERGTVVFDWEVTGPTGATVMTMTGRAMFTRRHPAPPQPGARGGT
ncbi:MAG: MaoC family dehydratase [Acidimicrobiales bacterium]